MCHVRTPVVQTQLGIACEFESSFPPAVFNSKSAYFRIDLRRDANSPRNHDVLGPIAELGPITMKTLFMSVLGREKNWLISDGPKRLARKISNVAKLPPAISCGILAPPSNVIILPRRPTRTRRSTPDQAGPTCGSFGLIRRGNALSRPLHPARRRQ
jgi:hypothetical protein